MIMLEPPILGEDLASGLPIMLIALDLKGDSCVFLAVDMDGLVRVQRDKDVKIDWRYSLERRKWYDASIGVDAVLKEDEDG